MLRKIFIMSTICAAVLSLSGPNVMAATGGTGGYNTGNITLQTWGFTWGSVDCNSVWTGLANLTKSPKEIQCLITPRLAIVSCMNPGGNTGGIGTPFGVDTGVLQGTTTEFKKSLEGHGKVDATITIENDVLFNYLFCNDPAWDPYTNNTCSAEDLVYPPNVCDQNDNWTPDPNGDVYITKLDAKVVGYYLDGVTCTQECIDNGTCPDECLGDSGFGCCFLNMDTLEYTCYPGETCAQYDLEHPQQ